MKIEMGTKPGDFAKMNELSKTTLQTTKGQLIEVHIGLPAKIESFFIFSMHKAGSTLLNQIIFKAATALGIPVFEPELEEYKNGVELGSLDESVLSLFKKNGYCFGGFRSFPPYLDDFDLKDFKKIWLIRDPRDILVSHYFSQKFSHGIPSGELGKKLQAMRFSLESKTIDEYAIEFAPPLRSKFKRYEAAIIDDNCRLFRYEDIVFEKRNWLKDMVEFLGLDLPQTEAESIIKCVDQRPKIEDPNRHIRKVTPGDHKEKLMQETIVQLNKNFKDILVRYDYDLEVKNVRRAS